MHVAKSTVIRTCGHYWDVQQNELKQYRADLAQGTEPLLGSDFPTRDPCWTWGPMNSEWHRSAHLSTPGPGSEVSLDVTPPNPVSHPQGRQVPWRGQRVPPAGLPHCLVSNTPGQEQLCPAPWHNTEPFWNPGHLQLNLLRCHHLKNICLHLNNNNKTNPGSLQLAGNISKQEGRGRRVDFGWWWRWVWNERINTRTKGSKFTSWNFIPPTLQSPAESPAVYHTATNLFEMIPQRQAPLLCDPTHSLASALLQWGGTDTVHRWPEPWKERTDTCLQNLALVEWETALNKHVGYKELERYWICFLFQWDSSGKQEQKTQEYRRETIAKAMNRSVSLCGCFHSPRDFKACLTSIPVLLCFLHYLTKITQQPIMNVPTHLGT